MKDNLSLIFQKVESLCNKVDEDSRLMENENRKIIFVKASNVTDFKPLIDSFNDMFIGHINF